MRASVSIAVAAAGIAFLVATCGQDEAVAPPAIPFAPLSDPSLKDPDNPTKVFRVDFARVEEEFPLSRADLMKLTPKNLALLSQEEIDQIYGRLTAGSIPDGIYEGNLFFARGSSMPERLEEIVGGIKGRFVGSLVDTLEGLVRLTWQGKTFDREQRIARTLVEDFAALRTLVDDPDTVTTVAVPRRGLLRFVSPTDRVWVLFPAKLYCGQSLIDGRRESVIIDYNYNDEIAGYRANPDGLLGRGGLALRDEIRQVRPGFYLGRAYVGHVFLLNFTLLNGELAERETPGFAAGRETAEDCWAGEQIRKAGAQR
jgi:hypothetical protein